MFKIIDARITSILIDYYLDISEIFKINISYL